MLYMSWFLLYNYNKRCILKHYYLNKSICLGFCSIGGYVSRLQEVGGFYYKCLYEELMFV